MTTLFDHYLTQSTLKFDRGLARLLAPDVQRQGTRLLKSQARMARSSATAILDLASAMYMFEPADSAAILTSAKALRRYARERDKLLDWAEDFLKFCADYHLTKKLNKVNAFALARWQGSKSDQDFEIALVRELRTPTGERKFAQWIHECSLYLDVKQENLRSCILCADFDDADLRHSNLLRTASILMSAKGMGEVRTTYHDEILVDTSWNLYERYLAHRRSLASSKAK